MTLTEREKFIMYSVAMHGLLTERNEERFFKSFYEIAKHYLPNMTVEQMEKTYTEEIEPEFNILIEKAEAFHFNKKKS